MCRKSHIDAATAQSGFVLLEVLIAAVIATLTLITVFHIYSTAFSGSARTERVTIALLAAESKMAALGVTEALQPGSSGGQLDGGYSWSTDIRPYEGLSGTDSATSSIKAYEVEVTVSWGRDAGQRITLSSLRLAMEDRRGQAR